MQTIDEMSRQSSLDEQRRRVHELVLECGQFLAELVVKLTGDGGALFLAREGDARGQSAELRF